MTGTRVFRWKVRVAEVISGLRFHLRALFGVSVRDGALMEVELPTVVAEDP
jgi:hypothetical protein